MNDRTVYQSISRKHLVTTAPEATVFQAACVMSRVQEMRGGRDNDPEFGSRMRGEGIFADLLAQRFAKACQRLDLNNTGRRQLQQLDCSQFKVPGLAVQGTLFG